MFMGKTTVGFVNLLYGAIISLVRRQHSNENCRPGVLTAIRRECVADLAEARDGSGKVSQVERRSVVIDVLRKTTGE